MKTRTMATAMILAAVGGATEASADDAMVTKTGSAAPATVSSQPPACGSIEDVFLTSCALTSSGITVYGIVDTGVSWRSHGAPFSGTSAPGVDYLVQRYSNRPRWDFGPNGLSQSNIGIKGKGARMEFHFRSAGRVRSLFVPISERAALGGSERRHTGYQPGLICRLQPGRTIL